jgi:hypothetical protein
MNPLIRLIPFVFLVGCINPASTDCSRGAWLGGAAGTDRCLPDRSYQPRYLPEQELRPYLDAIHRDAERRAREIERERRQRALPPR